MPCVTHRRRGRGVPVQLDPSARGSGPSFRCLQRLGLSRRPATKTTASGRFAPEPCSFIHLDLKHVTRLRGERAYAYVAIDRATRFVHLVEIHGRREAATARTFLDRFARVFPAPIRVVLTDNGSEFTDRFAVGCCRARAGAVLARDGRRRH
jgi:Integrase core domain